LREALEGVFTGLAHPYWSWRYTFGGKKLAAPRSLVGKERATNIIADVMIPLLLAHAHVEGDVELARRLHLLWSRLPRRAPNTVVRRMCQVLFHETADGHGIVNSSRRQHGLHQLYSDFCGSEIGCSRCVLYLAHRAGKELSAAV
jgi:hypothetical protein